MRVLFSHAIFTQYSIIMVDPLVAAGSSNETQASQNLGWAEVSRRVIRNRFVSGRLALAKRHSLPICLFGAFFGLFPHLQSVSSEHSLCRCHRLQYNSGCVLFTVCTVPQCFSVSTNVHICPRYCDSIGPISISFLIRDWWVRALLMRALSGIIAILICVKTFIYTLCVAATIGLHRRRFTNHLFNIPLSPDGISQQILERSCGCLLYEGTSRQAHFQSSVIIVLCPPWLESGLQKEGATPLPPEWLFGALQRDLMTLLCYA